MKYIKIAVAMLIFPIVGKAEILPESVNTKKIGAGNFISCSLFKNRLELILQRDSEFDILYKLKSKQMDKKSMNLLTGIVRRSFIPLPQLSDLIEFTVLFRHKSNNFDWSNYRYRIQTGFYDFSGIAPYFLDGVNIQREDDEVTKFNITVNYFESCFELKNIELELIDQNGQIIKYLATIL